MSILISVCVCVYVRTIQLTCYGPRDTLYIEHMSAMIERIKVLVPACVASELGISFPVQRRVYRLDKCFFSLSIYIDPNGYQNYDYNLYPHSHHRRGDDDFYAIEDSANVRVR